MNAPRIGALFAGYGGLDLAATDVFGGSMAWYSEIDKGALKVLAHRFPDVPNVGDVTKVDWLTVGAVDILTLGFPCQDVSTAGRRAGIRPGTRSGLWSHAAHAIAQLRPRMVVIENVRGLLSAHAHSDVEPCAWCLGDDTDGALRALGAVLGDLAAIGYDARWHSLRAADVGAAHGRLRVFIIATDTESERRPGAIEPCAVVEHDGSEPAHPGQVGGALLPTPRTSDTNGAGQHGDGGVDLRTAVSLLPTPAVNDMGAAYTPDEWDEWTDRMKAAHGNGNGHGKSLSIEAQRLLPTPIVSDSKSAANPAREGHVTQLRDLESGHLVWGDYAAAIARWETILGRPAPAPTQTSAKGNPQLSARFVEWLMGLPDGWVTDVPGITRNEALKALGNGVVPQQAAAALRTMLAWEVAA